MQGEKVLVRLPLKETLSNTLGQFTTCTVILLLSSVNSEFLTVFFNIIFLNSFRNNLINELVFSLELKNLKRNLFLKDCVLTNSQTYVSDGSNKIKLQKTSLKLIS